MRKLVSAVLVATLPFSPLVRPLLADETCRATFACRIKVASGAELAQALASTGCGCEIAVADGTYVGTFALRQSCPPDQPIVVRAERLLAPIIRSPLRMEGANATVEGLRFVGAEAGVVVGGRQNKVRRSQFTGWSGVAVRAVAGRGGEIAFNEFFQPAPWTIGGASRTAISSAESAGGLQREMLVRRNHFHDFPAKPSARYSSGQADAVEICGGRQPMSEIASGWTIDHNLVERHRTGQGVIDVKCGGTTVGWNTLTASPGGRIDVRSGSGNRLIANYLEDAGGMVIHGGNQQLVGNRIVRSGSLVLLAGNEPWDYAGPTKRRDGTPVHQASVGALLAGNAAPMLHIGRRYDATFTFPAEGHVIERHGGSVSYGLHRDTVLRSTTAVPVPGATPLASSEVGPLAPESCFNGLEYIASYPDLMAAFGADKAAGEAHHRQHGLQEGRRATFDGLAYLASYDDLRRAHGLDRDAAATHYIVHGAAEGRIANSARIQ